MRSRIRTALVAEPSAAERERLGQMLSALGFGRVYEAEDGLTALYVPYR